jgi:hypothetical protein
MLHLPERARAPGVVFLHGFTGCKHETRRLYVLTAREMARHGIASLRIDFRGSGDSAGDFSEMTITRELEDARAAVAFMRGRSEVDASRIGALGMSMGGMVAALLLGEDPGITAAVLWCPVCDFSALIRRQALDSAFAEGDVADRGGWPVGKAFAVDGLTHRPVEALARSKARVLILHGDRDQAVSCEESLLHKNVARREIVSGADHCFSSLAWAQQVVDSSSRWFRQCWS